MSIQIKQQLQEAESRIHQLFGKDLQDMFCYLPNIDEIKKQSDIPYGERACEWNAFFELHKVLTGTTDPYVWRFIGDVYSYQKYKNKNLPYPFDQITEYEANELADDEAEEKYMKWLESKLEEMFHMEEPWK